MHGCADDAPSDDVGPDPEPDPDGERSSCQACRESGELADPFRARCVSRRVVPVVRRAQVGGETINEGGDRVVIWTHECSPERPVPVTRGSGSGQQSVDGNPTPLENRAGVVPRFRSFQAPAGVTAIADLVGSMDRVGVHCGSTLVCTPCAHCSRSCTRWMIVWAPSPGDVLVDGGGCRRVASSPATPRDGMQLTHFSSSRRVSGGPLPSEYAASVLIRHKSLPIESAPDAHGVP